MVVSKPAIKTLFFHFILNNDASAVYFPINFYGFISVSVDESDDVTTPKAIRCANKKIFWGFDISVPTSDL